MCITTKRLPLLLIAVFVMSLGSPAAAQDRGRDRGGDRGGDQRQRWEDMSEEEREAMRERMRERMAEREAQQAEQMRERLEMSEDDFELIAPMINQVRDLIRERQFVNNSGRGGPGQRGGSFAIELSEQGQAVSDAIVGLRQAIEDDETDDIKKSLTQLREARAAHDQAVEDAREELRSVCTVKWEAEFVVMGLLD